jgi:hypothetical protein
MDSIISMSIIAANLDKASLISSNNNQKLGDIKLKATKV